MNRWYKWCSTLLDKQTIRERDNIHYKPSQLTNDHIRTKQYTHTNPYNTGMDSKTSKTTEYDWKSLDKLLAIEEDTKFVFVNDQNELWSCKVVLRRDV